MLISSKMCIVTHSFYCILINVLIRYNFQSTKCKFMAMFSQGVQSHLQFSQEYVNTCRYDVKVSFIFVRGLINYLQKENTLLNKTQCKMRLVREPCQTDTKCVERTMSTSQGLSSLGNDHATYESSQNEQLDG